MTGVTYFFCSAFTYKLQVPSKVTPYSLGTFYA